MLPQVVTVVACEEDEGFVEDTETFQTIHQVPDQIIQVKKSTAPVTPPNVLTFRLIRVVVTTTVTIMITVTVTVTVTLYS